VNLLDNDTADPVIGFNEESVRLCDVTTSPAEESPNCTALSVTVPGVGVYTLTESGQLTFTPEPDYLGTPEALPYIVIDNDKVLVSSTYTPTVLMPPPPTAVPDTSVGPFNQSQFANVVANDSPGTGAELDAGYLLMYNPDTDTWGIDPVETLDGVYTIEAATGIELVRARQSAATLYGTSFSVVVDPTFMGNLHKIVFTPVPGFVGTAEAVEYQIADIHGQTAETTYTPTIETEVLAETGSALLSDFWPVVPMMLVGALLIIATRRRMSVQ
jgi:CshA-type fibril repeat protein